MSFSVDNLQLQIMKINEFFNKTALILFKTIQVGTQMQTRLFTKISLCFKRVR